MRYSVVIGCDSKSGQAVAIDEEARARSVYIVGIQGTGKSTVLEQIAYQDMVNGDGLVFLDPHGDSIQTLLPRIPPHRAEDVIFWDPANRTHPIGLNPFSCLNPDEYDAKANSFIAALSSIAEFKQAFENAPRMKDILEHLAIAFVVNQHHALTEAPRFLEHESFRRQFYTALSQEYPHVRAYWETLDDLKPPLQRELVESSLNKLRRFQIHRTMRAVFGQVEPKLNIRRVMDERKILLVNLNRAKLGEGNASLIGAFLIFDILHAALSRIDTRPENRARFHIIADEFQTFLSTAFPTLIEEGRKYGVDVVVAHQIREQLAGDLKELTRAVGNLIVFRVTAPNAEALAGEFKIEIPDTPSNNLRSKFEVVRNILFHLEQRGHEDEEVMKGYWALKADLDKIVEIILWDLKRRSQSYVAHGENTSADYKIVELRRKQFEEYVNRLLYRIMTVPTPYVSVDDEVKLGLPQSWRGLIPYFDEFFRDVLSIHDYVWKFYEADTLFYDLWDQIDVQDMPPWRYIFTGTTFAEFLEHLTVLEGYIKTKNQELPPLLKELKGFMTPHMRLLWEDAYTLYYREKQVFSAICHLLYHLKAKPYLAQTGQPEPVLEKSRLYSDLGLEIANQLTNLPRFHARSKLEIPEGLANCEITTVKLDVPANPALAADIQARSIEQYASTPSLFDTIITDDFSGDDDELSFGEKKTAAHPRARRTK